MLIWQKLSYLSRFCPSAALRVGSEETLFKAFCLKIIWNSGDVKPFPLPFSHFISSSYAHVGCFALSLLFKFPCPLRRLLSSLLATYLTSYVLYICSASCQRISDRAEPHSTCALASSPRSVDMIDGSFTSTELLQYGPGGAL